IERIITIVWLYEKVRHTIKKRRKEGIAMKRVSMSRWSMYGIIVLVALNMRPAITSVGPLTNEIQETFGWSHVVVSSLTVIPVLCMGIFSLRATAWQARFGLERALFYAVGL